jgi:spore coat protein H
MINKLWIPVATLLLAASLLLGCSGQSITAPVPGNGAVVLAEGLPAENAELPEAEDTGDVTDSKVEDNAIARPDGWTEETHGKSADPDYDVVFPQDEVNRIDVTIDPENWQAMLDDMTDLYGEFGSQPSGGARGNLRQPPAQGNVQREVPRQRPEDAPQDEGNLPARRPGDMGMPGSNTGADDENPIWVPVTLDFEGNTWTDVGLRFKGNSSLRSSWHEGNNKLPFRLDFDQFEDDVPEIDDQRFYGFQKVTFSSNFQDASFLREKVTADLFREAGVTAANTAFYEVYIDYGDGPVYFGLYTMTEVIEDTVIEEQFVDDSGNVYKPDSTGASFAEGSFNKASFDKQTNEDGPDWNDIVALYEALHAGSRTADPVAWRAGLEEILDVDGFLNYLAINQVVQNWDTYGNMPHNYYLYHDPATDLLTWIPWDNNMALNSNVGVRPALSIALDEVSTQWPLIRYLLDDEVYHAQYVAYVESFIDTVFDPDEMAQTYRSLAALVEPYALAENEGYTMLRSDADFYDAIDALIAHAAERYESAAAYVAGQ